MPRAIMDTIQAALQWSDNIKASIDSIHDPETKQAVIQAIESMEERGIINDSVEVDDVYLKTLRENHIQRPRICAAYFILTEQCNFRCSYCHIIHSVQDRAEHTMSIERADKGLALYARLFAEAEWPAEVEPAITFYGGEPLLNIKTLYHLLEQIDLYKKNGRLPEKLETNMVTNGALMTPEIATVLLRHGVKVAVSLDGDAVAHDAHRHTAGQAASAGAKRALEVCRSVGLEPTLSVTVSETLLARQDQALDAIINEYRPRGMGFNIIVSTPNDLEAPAPDYPERAAAFLMKAFEVLRAHGIYEDRVMRRAKPLVKGIVVPYDCAASSAEQIVVAPDGQVGICHFYIGSRQYFDGHVDDAEFSATTNPVHNRWVQRSPLNMEACEGCEARGTCGGGCPMAAEQNTGSIWGLDTRHCVHAKATQEWLVWDVYRQSQQSEPTEAAA